MKISHLIVVVVILALGAAGIKYSLDLQKALTLHTTVHGAAANADESSASGLLASNKKATTVVDELASQRSESSVLSEKSRIDMTDMRSRRNDAESELTQKQEELSGWESKIRESEDKVVQMTSRYKEVTDGLREQFGDVSDELQDETDMSAFIESVKTMVENCTSERKKLLSEVDEAEIIAQKEVSELADNNVKHKNISKTNSDWISKQRKNSEEYTISAVDNRWNFVIFNASKDSGLFPGDTTVLLARRNDGGVTRLRVTSVTGNQVVAEFDPKVMPAGVRLEAGNKVFRQQAVAP